MRLPVEFSTVVPLVSYNVMGNSFLCNEFSYKEKLTENSPPIKLGINVITKLDPES